MTDLERAFLDDIAAHPQDDARRLIYADWLEEQGRGERAEFIRVQCRLAAEKFPCACTCEYEHGIGCPAGIKESLRRREHELLATEGPPILGAKHRQRFDTWETLAYRWAPVPVLECDWWEFRRGFIASITLPCAAFLEHAADIIEAVPMLEEVRLSDIEPHEIHIPDGPITWVYHRAMPNGNRWPDAFDNALRLTHPVRDAALNVMSYCCLQFAHDQLTARRNFRRRPLTAAH